MIKKKTRVFSFLIGAFLTGGILLGSLSFADGVDGLTKQIEQLEREIKENKGNAEKIKASMAKIEEEIQDAGIEIEKLDTEGRNIQAKIDENTAEITRLDSEIENMNNEIDRLEKELEESKELFGEQAKLIYTRGNTSTIEMFFSGKSLESAMSFGTIMDNISDKNRELFDEIISGVETIEKNKKQIIVNRAEVEVKKQDNMVKKDQVDEKRAKTNRMADKLKEKRSDYRAMLSRYNVNVSSAEAEIAANRAAIQRIIREAENQKKNNGDKPIDESNVTGEQIVALASKFLGDPYLWGGTKPYNGSWKTGFDCSGLVQYVYRQYGITTGRTTYDQIDHPNGVKVSRENLQIGDLVFFGTWSNPHHVGLYMGDNKYIHAPKTGDVVKISPMTRRDFLIGRRFIK